MREEVDLKQLRERGIFDRSKIPQNANNIIQGGCVMEPKLVDLTIEVTQRCPNNCVFCSSLSSLKTQGRLNRNEILKISNQAVLLGLKRISISGGEPLLHPDIFSIVDNLYALGLHVAVYTTGISLDIHGKVRPFLDWQNFEHSQTTLIFNVQSTDEEIHDQLSRRKGSLCLTRRSILDAKNKGFRVEVHLVPNRINLYSLAASVADFKEWGVDQISFLRLVPQGYAKENADLLILNSAEKSILKNTFTQLANNDWGSIQLRFGVPFAGILNLSKYCNAGETKLIIRYDGKVLPCEAFKDSRFDEYILGDIRTDDLRQILYRGTTSGCLQRLKAIQVFGETCPAQLLYCGVS
jgi:radical SAM protein with 4Fe4S-binding SPASM domain